MEEPKPKDKYEFWLESVILLVLLVLVFVIGVYGSISCSAYHPCPVWAQIIVWSSSSMFNVFANLLLILVVGPAIIKRVRQRKRE